MGIGTDGFLKQIFLEPKGISYLFIVFCNCDVRLPSIDFLTIGRIVLEWVPGLSKIGRLVKSHRIRPSGAEMHGDVGQFELLPER